MSNGLSVKIRGLSLLYDTNEVLRSLDLELGSGEIILITGYSGSGKTSLLRILLGSIPKIFPGVINGYFQPDIEVLNKLTFYLPQEPWFGVASPYVWSEISTVAKIPDINTVGKVLDKFDLSHLINRSTYTLSAGEIQRILIILALLSNKRILLLDEPTSYLDEHNANLFVELVSRLSREMGVGLVIIDHRIDLWSRYVDNIYVLDKGKIEDYSNSSYEKIYRLYIDKIHSLKRDLAGERRDRCLEFRMSGFKYPGSGRLLLRELEGELCYGNIILIKGPSGSGKSTLLKILIERILDKRYRDEVYIKYRNISEGKVKRDIMYIPDNPLLFFTEPTVNEELSGSIDLLKKLGVPENRSSLSIKRLSSGERRRVALLSAVARGGRLLFIDEPTVGLDPYNKYLYLRFIRELASEKNYGFIIASHDPHIELIADEIIRIN